MNRVMAVCIEEDPGGDGMTIRLASNSGDLAFVTKGFNNIARTLEHASLKTKPRASIRQDLFRQVVILDESRILSRLRSRHAARTRKTIGKPKLLPLLDETVHNQSFHSSGKLKETNLALIQSSTRQLSTKFSEFEAARQCDSSKNASRDILLDLLAQIGQFDVSSLQTALESSPDRNLKEWLPQSISKIGRYYQITCDLVDAARSDLSKIFRRISVHAVRQPCLDMRFVAGHAAGFEETIGRVTRSSPKYRQSGFEPGHVAAVRKKYQNHITDGAAAWKAHAEIQILLFYEQTSSTLPPRIIGSSKSACYLNPIDPQPATSSGSIPIPETSINQDNIAASLSAGEMHVQKPLTPPVTTSSCSLPIPKTVFSKDDVTASVSADDMGAQEPTTEPFTTTHRVCQGDSTSCRLTRKSDTFVVDTAAGTICTSWDVPSGEDIEPRNLRSSRACWIQVTSLPSNAQEEQSVKRLEGIDVHSLKPGHDLVVENGSALSFKELTLQLQGHTLLIKYSFEDLESYQVLETTHGAELH
ncbi:MAG: hypothetical protein Q9200_007111 [Gallowayella weberi]